MFRVLLVIHRYLGIAIGLLVVLWCLSAFVMMYMQFPELRDDEYLSFLPTLDGNPCCSLDVGELDGIGDIDEVLVESIGGMPVLRVRDGYGRLHTFDIGGGRRVDEVPESLARQQAETWFRSRGISASTELLGSVERDQWTVSGTFDELRPFFLYSAGDEGGNHIYISSVTGDPVQDSTRNERFWNWLGSVVHWIYPTVLRKDTALWAQVVIWTTVISIFLVVVGAYLGIRQLGGRPDAPPDGPHDGKLSPYTGCTLWHHYAGVVFGLFTLTWLLSGLFSMNPWGMFIGDDGRSDRASLHNYSIAASDVASLVSALSQARLPSRTVRIRATPFDGDFVVAAYDAKANIARLDGRTLEPKPLAADTWSRLPSMLRPGQPLLAAGWISEDDNYYFSHHEEVALPAYRLIFDDAERTRFYFNKATAELTAKFDSARRGHRWWFQALHRGDFAGLGRSRPAWDILLLGLLFGVTTSAVTGFYLGIRRLL